MNGNNFWQLKERKDMNAQLKDFSTADDQSRRRRPHLIEIPIHWRYGTYETIEIRHRHIGGVAPLALIAKTQRIIVSKSNGRSVFAR